MPEIPQKIGPFKIEQRIGAGGMGVVYLGRYSKTGQKAAIKVLAPDLAADDKLLSRFEREIDILKKLRHENIVRYFGGGRQGQQRFYAMEIVTGGALDSILKERGKFTWEEVIDYSKQIAAALEHAHNAGVIHRDLKPANLLISKAKTLKLTDFGIARDTNRTALTAAGKTLGTFSYMAPEQITGKTAVSHKTDLYALGCVMYEMLTGRPPFVTDDPTQTLFKHIDEPAPPVREHAMDCPIWLDKLVMKMLEKDPQDRPYDALAVQVELDKVVEKVAERATVSEEATAGVTKTDARKKKKKRRKKKQRELTPFYERTWFLSLALVLVIGVVTWLLWPLSENQLMARAEKRLANADELYEKKEVQRRYLEPLLERFPDGEHAAHARELIDQIEMENAEDKIEGRVRRNDDPKTEGERLYLEARNTERFGDALTAMEKYESLITLLEDSAKSDQEDRNVMNLAKRELNRLKGLDLSDSDRAEFLNGVLAKADEEFFQEGNEVSAREKWRSIITLYRDNQEFSKQVAQARSRLEDPHGSRARDIEEATRGD